MWTQPTAPQPAAARSPIHRSRSEECTPSRQCTRDSTHSGSSDHFISRDATDNVLLVSLSPSQVPVNTPTSLHGQGQRTHLSELRSHLRTVFLTRQAQAPSTTLAYGQLHAHANWDRSCGYVFVVLHSAPGSEGITTITSDLQWRQDHSRSASTTTIMVTQRPTMTVVQCNPVLCREPPTSCAATVTDIGPGMPLPPTDK